MRRPLAVTHGLLLQDAQEHQDPDGILDKCIQAAMPKFRSMKGKPASPRHNHGIPGSPRPAVGKPPSGSPISPVASLPSALPRKTASCSASPHASPRHRPVPVARVSPAMKPTPHSEVNKSSIATTNGKINYSEEVKNWGEIEGTPMGFSNATSLSDLTVDSFEQETHSLKKTCNLPRTETPKQYATEDTPANFSRCDSLSSLSCEDDAGQVTCRSSNVPQRNTSAPVARNGLTERDEVPHHFNVEDTPALMSRRSSLSSIDGVACDLGTTAKPTTSQRTPADAIAPCNFGVEDTPVCFSRNSSLSSLSVESYPEETTPSEQALLQHCINQGMPRGEQRLSRGNAARGSKRAKSGSRIPGLSQSPGRSPARSPAINIPAVPMQRLQLVPVNANSRENSTNTTEAESSKLRSELEQSEKKQLETSEVACIDDDQSMIDDITEVTEPVSDVTTAPIAEVSARKLSTRAGHSAITSSGGASSSPEEKQSSGDETRGSSGRGVDKFSWGSGQGLGSDVSMTDSMIVATEALRVARAVEVQGQDARSSDDTSIMSQSINSEALLENIAAPSGMESVMSLSTSLNDEQQRTQHQPRKMIECRHTRKIPAMVRRALGDQEMTDNGINGGSLASSCHSNLDNVIPPSFMEADDMESSMISVASITSEVADQRHSPPSLTSSIPSEAMAAIEAPAQQLAKLFMKEARYQASTVTLTAGDDTSTCQEVTELDRDETMGRYDTATDTDLATDDIPADIPELPQDSPLHRSRNSPQVTPSMLRKAMQNDSRYRTFSRGEKSTSLSAEGTSKPDQSKPSVSPRLTPRQRRIEQGERFLTRVISTEDEQEPESPTTPKAEESFGTPRQIRSLREKRQANPVRYQTRTIESGTSSKYEDEGLIEFRDGAELDLTADQIEALSQDANIVICTLNENREANTADLLHGLSQENILDIETLSLISSDEEDNTFDVDTPPGPSIPARPRIVKPSEQTLTAQVEVEEDGTNKGIRGRRKGLYPGARKVQIPVKPSPQLSPSPRVIATPAAAFRPTPRSHVAPPVPITTGNSGPTLQQPGSPKLPRATRASELRQKAGRVGSSSSSSPASSAGSSPRMGTGTRARQPPPSTHITQQLVKRQNTFTKEDLEEQLQARSISKPRYRKDVVQPTPLMMTRQGSKPGSSDANYGLPRSSQPKSCSLTRDARPPSANDMADWNKDAKTGKVAKKDVSSRIANLWKKVEKAQAAHKPKGNDARVWISKTKNKTPDQNSPPPLVRSSTYEKLTLGGESRSDSERTDSSKSKTRLGLKLSRLRGRDTKSSPPSEVNTPVDSRPQCLVSPSRTGGSSSRPRLSLASGRAPSCEPEQHCDSTATTPDGKRLSRLGSFVVMDGEEDFNGVGVVRSPQSAMVAPFNYQPPASPGGSRSSSISSNSQRRLAEDRSSTPGPGTRIPLPAAKSPFMSNNPRDDNGNSPYV